MATQDGPAAIGADTFLLAARLFSRWPPPVSDARCTRPSSCSFQRYCTDLLMTASDKQVNRQAISIKQ